MGTFAQPGVTLSYDRGAMRIDSDGVLYVHVLIKNPGGREVDRFEVRVPLSGPITDASGGQLAAGVPGAISSARTSLLAAIDSAIDSAAAAGKFSR